MNVKQRIEKIILKLGEKILPCTTFDRLLIERRRRINKVTENYPYAGFLSKKKSDKKYCIVRYSEPTFGLMAAGIQYVFSFHQLLKRGYIPIIDIEYTYSFKQGRIGESNIWDSCFKQPVTAKEAALQPYVLVAGELFSYSDDPSICLDLNEDVTDHFIHVRKENFRAYYAKAKKYVEPIWQVKDEILSELDEEIWNQVNGKRILGVFLREEFSNDTIVYSEKHRAALSNHPLHPGVKETIEIIKTQLANWKYDLIFLSTVYADSVKQFKEVFGDKVVCIDRERMNIGKPIVDFGMNEQESYEVAMSNISHYQNESKAYLMEIIALSQCDYLLGGPSSGMAAALVMNGGKYDDIYVLEDTRKIKRY